MTQIWTDGAGNYFTGQYGTVAITRQEAARLAGGAKKPRAAVRRLNGKGKQ